MADQAQDQAPPAGGGQGAGWVDPYRGFNFKLEVLEGQTDGHFVECSGLQVEVDVISHREGGSDVNHRIPGLVTYGPVTLRYGLTQSSDLWDWMQKVVTGNVERRHVSVVMMKPDGVTEALRWNLNNAWPSRWQGAPLDASASEVAIETMTLVFESMERA